MDFSVTYSFRTYHGPGVDSAPSENEYQKHFLGVKAAGLWGWQPHHLHVPNVMEIWEPKPPSGPHRACYGTALPFTYLLHFYFLSFLYPPLFLYPSLFLCLPFIISHSQTSLLLWVPLSFVIWEKCSLIYRMSHRNQQMWASQKDVIMWCSNITEPPVPNTMKMEQSEGRTWTVQTSISVITGENKITLTCLFIQ